jgi:hypothetical protein
MSVKEAIDYNCHIKDFLFNGSTCAPLSAIDRHVLAGWKLDTLTSDNTAVWKFFKFWQSKQASPFCLPALANDIYDVSLCDAQD